MSSFARGRPQTWSSNVTSTSDKNVECDTVEQLNKPLRDVSGVPQLSIPSNDLKYFTAGKGASDSTISPVLYRETPQFNKTCISRPSFPSVNSFIHEPGVVITPASNNLTLSDMLRDSSPSVDSQASMPPNNVKKSSRRNAWGPETYSDLIAIAIQAHTDKQATLQQIYDYIATHYDYFRERSDPASSAGWKNSIRHNLSLHEKFVKCPKSSDNVKSSYWRLNEEAAQKPYTRKRASSTGLKASRSLKQGPERCSAATSTLRRSSTLDESRTQMTSINGRIEPQKPLETAFAMPSIQESSFVSELERPSPSSGSVPSSECGTTEQSFFQAQPTQFYVNLVPALQPVAETFTPGPSTVLAGSDSWDALTAFRAGIDMFHSSDSYRFHPSPTKSQPWHF